MSFRSRELRKVVGRRDGWRCHYCKAGLSFKTATLDHVVPRALGGTWHSANLRIAWLKCNRAKANQPPHVFHALLMQGLIA